MASSPSRKLNYKMMNKSSRTRKKNSISTKNKWFQTLKIKLLIMKKHNKLKSKKMIPLKTHKMSLNLLSQVCMKRKFKKKTSKKSKAATRTTNNN